jgi:hypothetical protein
MDGYLDISYKVKRKSILLYCSCRFLRQSVSQSVSQSVCYLITASTLLITFTLIRYKGVSLKIIGRFQFSIVLTCNKIQFI